jgi:imidazolonepropionase-like amidohydrolase
VIVEDGKIVVLGPAESVSIPRGTRRIDGANRYLMPGLVDMHVHFIRPAIPGKPQKSSADTYAAENSQLALLFQSCSYRLPASGDPYFPRTA